MNGRIGRMSWRWLLAMLLVTSHHAFAQGPPDATAFYERAMANLDKGELDQAIANFTKAVELNRAFSDYNKALEINPN